LFEYKQRKFIGFCGAEKLFPNFNILIKPKKSLLAMLLIVKSSKAQKNQVYTLYIMINAK
jgi:hypothetical protein